MHPSSAIPRHMTAQHKRLYRAAAVGDSLALATVQDGIERSGYPISVEHARWISGLLQHLAPTQEPIGFARAVAGRWHGPMLAQNLFLSAEPWSDQQHHALRGIIAKSRGAIAPRSLVTWVRWMNAADEDRRDACRLRMASVIARASRRVEETAE